MAIFNINGQEVTSTPSIVIDDTLSATSDNPIKNKAVTVNVNSINEDIGSINTNINTVNTSINTVNTSINSIYTAINRTTADIQNIEKNIDKIELCADYEVGDWNSGNVWYAYEEGKVANGQCVGTGPYHLSYDYCTLEDTVHKVIDWQTIYYSLPVACTYHVEFQIAATDGKTYKIKTLDKSGVPVVEITITSGAMTGNWGDSISFTLRYKYK